MEQHLPFSGLYVMCRHDMLCICICLYVKLICLDIFNWSWTWYALFFLCISYSWTVCWLASPFSGLPPVGVLSLALKVENLLFGMDNPSILKWFFRYIIVICAASTYLKQAKLMVFGKFKYSLICLGPWSCN